MSTPSLPDWLLNLPAKGVPKVPDRWLASIVLSGLDGDAQLVAIRRLLQRNREAEKQFNQDIEEIKAFAEKITGLRNEQAVDDLIEHYHDGVYQDAAHSMAAVGMLAHLQRACSITPSKASEINSLPRSSAQTIIRAGR